MKGAGLLQNVWPPSRLAHDRARFGGKTRACYPCREEAIDTQVEGSRSLAGFPARVSPVIQKSENRDLLELFKERLLWAFLGSYFEFDIFQKMYSCIWGRSGQVKSMTNRTASRQLSAVGVNCKPPLTAT